MLTFPEGFLWGAATAAHQIEGNNVNSDWWPQGARRRHHHRRALSGDAADSYHRYREDIELLADAGPELLPVQHRVGPHRARARASSPAPSVDHYRRMVDTCHEFGIEPIVTLHALHGAALVRATTASGARRTPPTCSPATPSSRCPSWPRASSTSARSTSRTSPRCSAGGEDAARTSWRYGLPRPRPQVADALLDSHQRSPRGARAGDRRCSPAGPSPPRPSSRASPAPTRCSREYGHPRDDWYLENGRRRRLRRRAGVHPHLHRPGRAPRPSPTTSRPP